MEKVDYVELKKLYEEQGFTYDEIASKFQCSKSHVRKVAKRHGLKSIRGKSKHRKIIIQKSIIPLSIKETKLFYYLPKTNNYSYLEVVIGSLLGDSYIKVRENNNYNSYNVYLAQSGKQLEYLKYKRSFFQDDQANQIRKERDSGEVIIKGKKCNQTELYIFSTKPLEELSNLYPLLTENDKKIIRKEYLELLTPLSLAIWYMDDGSFNYQNRIIRIATMCFSYNENKIIQDYFYNNLKMPCFLERVSCGKGYSLCLTQNSSKKFIQLTEPYKCNYMNYKFPKNFTPSETLKVN